jgi:quinol monooxygenase YgiN
MSKVVVAIKTKCQPGQREAVRGLYEKHLAPRARDNAEQELILVSYDAADPDTLYLFEVYANSQAFECNGQSPWFGEHMKAVGPLLASQPEVGVAQPVWAKGLTI